MNSNPYFIKRIGTAKMIGMAFGLLGFFMIPYLWPGESMWLRVGVLLWYTTFGAMIGVVGMFDYHPMLKFRMPFWFRGPVFGAWYNLVLVFLLHDKLSVLLQQAEGAFGGFTNPFWIVPEGAVLGLVIDAAATKIAGEGMPASGRTVV